MAKLPGSQNPLEQKAMRKAYHPRDALRLNKHDKHLLE